MDTSQVKIINKALILIGANPITDITDSSRNAQVVNRIYNSCLRDILSECKWNFATKRLLLTASADVLAWYDTGETSVYVRPTDVVKIFEVNPDYAIWREEGDYIISDTAGLGIRYVSYIQDPVKFSPEFEDAFIDLLAAEMAFAIVNSSSLAQKYRELYETVSLPDAMSSNSQSGTQQTIKDDAWEQAKYQNWSNNA